MAEDRDIRQAGNDDGADRKHNVEKHRAEPRTRDPRRQPQPEHEQQQDGGAPRRKEQDVRTPLVPMLRRAERAQDERGYGEGQDWKP
jgi:hypothetical protein